MKVKELLVMLGKVDPEAELYIANAVDTLDNASKLEEVTYQQSMTGENDNYVYLI